MSKVRIVSLVLTCGACPSQWDGRTDDGRKVYIRYRHGFGSVRLAAPGDDSEYAAVEGEEIAAWTSDDPWDGFIEEADMMAKTAEHVDWSDLQPAPSSSRREPTHE